MDFNLIFCCTIENWNVKKYKKKIRNKVENMKLN